MPNDVKARIKWRLHRERFRLAVRAARLSPFWRLKPLAESLPTTAGGPVDRRYIDAFMERHSSDIAGRVLEAGGYVTYGTRLGGQRVDVHDILYPFEGFPDATVVGDLQTGDGLPDASYDCLILTQVFQYPV